MVETVTPDASDASNLSLRRLTAPKQEIDSRADAWLTTGSLSSDGTHMRQRVPCCWKWHSLRLDSSTSSGLARNFSFFNSPNLLQNRLRDLWPRSAKPEPPSA